MMCFLGRTMLALKRPEICVADAHAPVCSIDESRVNNLFWAGRRDIMSKLGAGTLSRHLEILAH